MAAKPKPNSRLVSFLVVGKTGVGKSSLINSVAGKEVAEEGEDLDIGTYNIESYEVTHESATIRLWDTPGLFDMTKRSDSYMDQIREKYQECDLVLYCSDMTDTRITQQDKQAIETFTRSLGPAFWQRTCFVFTFANCVENPRSKTTAKYFTDTKQSLQDAYCRALKEAGVPADITKYIPFIPAGYHPWSTDREMYILLDGNHWISAFWISCFARAKDSQKVPHTVPPKKSVPPAGSTQPPAKLPTRDQCTFKTHHRDYIKQDWFECYTCWGGNSSFGCCWPCALDCHRGHQIVRHHAPTVGRAFFCDCGLNKHQPAVCTYFSTGKEFHLQPFYRCHSCFSINTAGVCHQCSINCHRGHQVVYAGETSGFCDCGLSYCKSNCRIPRPM